jgi:anhydro-N-acetylmuramic acid kinase
VALFVGLMSGTSLDGVDGVLVDLQAQTLKPSRVLAHAHVDFPEALANELLSLNSPGENELHRAALATNALMGLYADVVDRLRGIAGVDRQDVVAVGAHGQTVRHRPHLESGPGYTLQLANGALLAELCGICTVCDFRTADVAAGGQGAPLVPAFHAACFAEAGVDLALLNVGGIANLTLLHADGAVGGFDTGPGNVLLNAWSQRTLGQPFDDGGRVAASGRVLPDLLARLLAEPYFSMPPPKSTGRDLFDATWLDTHLSPGGFGKADVMATLAELTARSAANALLQQFPQATRLWVCGGGAFNAHLMQRWRDLLPAVEVRDTNALGVPPDHVEALAFAWLAACRLQQQPASLPAVTGARGGPKVLGAVYAAQAD